MYNRYSAFLLIITEVTFILPTSASLITYLTYLLLSQLIKITGGDNTRGQSNNSYTEQRRKHTYETTDIGDRAHIAITYRGKYHGCPIQGIKERTEGRLTCIWVYVGFDIEQYECRHKDIEQGQNQDRRQDLTFLFKTLVSLNRRVKRKSLNAGLSSVTAGRIDSRSMIAIKENG